jgi:hypothetical protein
MTTETLAAVQECLRICDMYRDENWAMCTDSILTDPVLKGRRDPEAFEIAEKNIIHSCVHSSMYHAAKNIGNAIREHFGLPVSNID